MNKRDRRRMSTLTVNHAKPFFKRICEIAMEEVHDELIAENKRLASENARLRRQTQAKKISTKNPVPC